MPVTIKEKAAAAQPVQPIALKLSRLNRYIRLGDPMVYEAKTIYEFTKEAADVVLRYTDETGIPVFKFAEKEQPVIERVYVQEPRRVVVNHAPQPAIVQPVPTSGRPKAIVIEDDDPALAARLAAIDNEDAGDPVSL